MIIAHNMMAYNASRMYGLNENSKAKTTEKLSSGYRINRAADDAANLAISEKMRRQIRGLTQAKYNIQDGISLCQVKDGALDEVHGLLQRMNELSVKAANGTESDEDRSYIQQEIDQISLEINRIGETTTFNEIPIFDYKETIKIPAQTVELVKSGAIGSGYLTEAYKDTDGYYYPAANLDFSNINKDTVVGLYGKSFSFTCSASCGEAFKFTFVNGDGTKSSASNLSGKVLHTYTIDIGGAKNGVQVLDRLFSYVNSNMPNGYSSDPTGNRLMVSHSNIMQRTSDSSFSLIGRGKTGSTTAEGAKSIFASKTGQMRKANCSEIGSAIIAERDINALVIQAGAEVGQVIYVTMDKMNAKLLDVDPLDVTTQTNARSAINRVKRALSEISSQRSTAGAEQNRLEHAYKVNDNVVENTTASESKIRDTDMSFEMMKLSMNNILEQAGTMMISQANQSNQAVLSLLQ